MFIFYFPKHFWNLISFTDSENHSHITIINASTSKANHYRVNIAVPLNVKFFFIKKFCLSFNFIEIKLNWPGKLLQFLHVLSYTCYTKPSFKSVHKIYMYWYIIRPCSFKWYVKNSFLKCEAHFLVRINKFITIMTQASQ